MNSKKIMIAAIALSAVLLAAVAVFGGIAFGGGSHGTAPHSTEEPGISADISDDPVTPLSPDDTLPPSGGADTASPQPGPGDTEPAAPVTAIPVSSSQSAATDAPAGRYRAVSGRLSSTNDGYIKLMVDWKTLERTADEALVECRIMLSFYSLDVGPRFGGKLTVAGKTYTYNTDAISYTELSKREVELAVINVTVPLISGCGSTTLSCSWPFKGSYSGIMYEDMTISGILEIAD